MDDFADDFEYDEVPIIPKDVDSIEEFQSRYRRKSVEIESFDGFDTIFDYGTDERVTAIRIRPRPIRKYPKEIEDILSSKSDSDSEDTSKTSAYEELELQMAGSEEKLKLMNLALKDFHELDSKTRKWLAARGYSEEFYDTLNTEARRDTLRCLECTAQCKYRELYDSLS